MCGRRLAKGRVDGPSGEGTTDRATVGVATEERVRRPASQLPPQVQPPSRLAGAARAQSAGSDHPNAAEAVPVDSSHDRSQGRRPVPTAPTAQLPAADFAVASQRKSTRSPDSRSRSQQVRRDRLSTSVRGRLVQTTSAGRLAPFEPSLTRIEDRPSCGQGRKARRIWAANSTFSRLSKSVFRAIDSTFVAPDVQ